MTKAIKTMTFGIGKPQAYFRRAREIKPLEAEQGKLVYESLRNISKCFSQIVNQMIALKFSETVLGIPVKEFTDFKTNYKPIAERLGFYDIIGSGILNQANVLALAHFSGEHGKDLLARGIRQLPTQRTDGTSPIEYYNPAVNIVEQEKKIFLCVCTYPKKFIEDSGLPTQWLAFPMNFNESDKSGLAQMKRVASGEWEYKNARIQRLAYGKNKWRGQLIVSYEPQPFKPLKENVVMGVDLGINTPATVHIRTDGAGERWSRGVGDGRGLLATRQQYKAEIERWRRALTTKGAGLSGQARTNTQKKLKELKNKEKNVVKNGAKTVAAQIAEIARRNGAGVWQFEDLQKGGMRENSWIARHWAPGMLLDAVRWQASQCGAELVLIDPAYTSQRCSTCGHIDRANRPKGKKGAAEFTCIACGHHENADKNASRNISITNIAGIISEWKEKSTPAIALNQ